MTRHNESLCPLCGNSGCVDLAATEFLDLPQSNRPVSVFRCRPCNFRWLNPQPRPENIQNLYTQEGYFERPEHHYSYANQALENRPCLLERTTRFKKNSPNGQILDAGCATGEFLFVAREQGIPAVGVEVSNYACEVARRRNLNVIHGDLDSDQLSRASFSGIHMSHVLEHLPNPVHAMRRVRELLVPGGLVYIEVPYQFDGLLDTLDRWQRRRMTFGPFSIHHVSFFSPNSLAALLRQTGFRVTELRTYLPCRRETRPKSFRLRLLTTLLWAADRLLKRGDIISVWARRDNGA